jgi:hypothetical protein
VEALRRVLADGFSNSARIDLDTLIVKAIRGLDPPHVEALAAMDPSASSTTWTELANALPHLAASLPGTNPKNRGALHPIMSVLERHDCVTSAWDDNSLPFRMILAWQMTAFGRQCLRSLGPRRDGSCRIGRVADWPLSTEDQTLFSAALHC